MRPIAVPLVTLFRMAVFAALSALAVTSAAQGFALLLAVLALGLIALSAARDAAGREAGIEARKARVAAAKAVYMARRPLLAANVNIAPRHRDGAA